MRLFGVHCQLLINFRTFFLLCRLKEFIKEQLIIIPTAATAAAQPVPQPTSSSPPVSDPGALLAGLL